METPHNDDSPPTVTVGEDDYSPGTLVAGRYRIEARIGDGAMGSVYRAEHEGLQRRVALKFLHESFTGNREIASRFLREAVAAARIRHPHVIDVYDTNTDERGRCFLVLEYFDGEPLRVLLEREGALPRPRAIELSRQVAAALDHAHALGIVHRDIKPENVLVQHGAQGDLVKVIDFGIAKVFQPDGPTHEALTRGGIVLGTPEYMAPEQALGGAVDHRADLYALAVTAYEMLVGRRPFDEDDVMALLARHLSAPPPPPSAVRPDAGFTSALDAVFAKALAKSPGDRHASAAEFVAELERAFDAPAPVIALAPVEHPRADPVAAVMAHGRAALASVRARWRETPAHVRRAVVACTAIVVGGGVVGLALRPRERRPEVVAEAPVERPHEAAQTDTLRALRARIDALHARPELAARTMQDRRRAAVALEAVRAQAPGDAAVLYALGEVYTRDRGTAAQGLTAYGDAVRAAPELARDDELIDDVIRVYGSNASLAAPAEELLKGPLARYASPRLLDVCVRGAPACARAAALLGEAPFAASLSAGERALVALSAARTCAARRTAIEALERDGDAQALPVLRRVPRGRDCGFLGMETCNPCLGTAVPDAIRAIEAREGDGGAHG